MNGRMIAALCTVFATLGCTHDASTLGGTSPNTTDLVAKSEKVTWVLYTDPAEGAFSMDVPVGWQVQGGMYRFGYFDVRWMMDVRSLDSKVILRIMDVNVPPYTVPGPETGREGQEYARPRQTRYTRL